MEFNSQICTTREQSERLLALGLKNETADCCHRNNSFDGKPYTTALFVGKHSSDIPAWSFSRLLELLYDGAPTSIRNLMKFGCNEMNYATIINCIGDLIKLNQFNKDYLEDKQ